MRSCLQSFDNQILMDGIFSQVLPGESEKRPAFERLLLPEYISNDDLQYLIK